jgi:hypothetical protein
LPETVLIVEGQGDVSAFPNLVGKIGAWLGMGLYTKKPIRAGCWGAVRKAGGLEKWVGLAVTRPDCSKVIIVVDLDDGCPVEEKALLQQRVDALSEAHGIEINICFCLREFEAWFLRSIDHLAVRFPQLADLDHEHFIEAAQQYRDAKGMLRRILPEGYSESYDQSDLLSSVDPPTLFARDRAFRRFVRVLSGLDYETLAAA